MAGTGVLKPISDVAFGDGGHNPDNTPKPSDSAATGLYHEIDRQPVTVLMQEDPFSATGKGVISSDNFPAVVISEAGLLDEDGNLLCWKTFAPKYLENGETYGVNLKMRF
jgi:hypothetical protein